MRRAELEQGKGAPGACMQGARGGVSGTRGRCGRDGLGWSRVSLPVPGQAQWLTPVHAAHVDPGPPKGPDRHVPAEGTASSLRAPGHVWLESPRLEAGPGL